VGPKGGFFIAEKTNATYGKMTLGTLSKGGGLTNSGVHKTERVRRVRAYWKKKKLLIGEHHATLMVLGSFVIGAH